MFKMWSIFTIASAAEDDGAVLKFYLYSKHTNGSFICIELQINKSERKIILTTKAPH